MKILVTGSFGSLGTKLLDLLKNSSHEISCFSTKSRRAKRGAKKFRKNFQIIYGDIRNYSDVKNAVKDCECVIHLAAIVPPRFNSIPLDYSREVNVEGTKNIIQAIEELGQNTKVLYTSSVAVFGDVRERGACVLASDEPVNPNADDIYAQQKVAAEELIRTSDLDWSIFRFGFMPDVDSLKFDKMMFDVPLDTNMELIDVRDAAQAIATGLEKEEIWGRIWHIAGGDGCRLTYKEFVGGMLETMGLGALPDEAFGSNDFHCAFFDTDKSEALLNYQQRTYDDLLTEIKANNKAIIFFARLFRPVARLFLLQLSPYYKTNKKRKKEHRK